MVFKNILCLCALGEGSLSIGRVWMVFKNLCVFVLWAKVASALEGLTGNIILNKAEKRIHEGQYKMMQKTLKND